MKRLFLAAWPDADAAPLLESLQHQLQSELENQLKKPFHDACPDLDAIRWTSPNQWHLTLHFLANVETERLTGLLYRLRTEDWTCFPAPMQRLDSLFLWPSPAGAQVIAWGAKQAHPLLRELHGRIGELIQAEGIWTEDRKLVPHVTLARSSGKSPLPARLWAEAQSAFSPIEFGFSGFHLVESVQTSTGSAYHRLADFELAASANPW